MPDSKNSSTFEITCPHCKAELELDYKELQEHLCICPSCEFLLITINRNIRMNNTLIKLINILILIVSLSVSVKGQINAEDSSVQVIGFWNINDKHTYVVSSEEFQVRGTDTTDREFSSYTVDVTILDSSADSYTVEWFYRDYSFSDQDTLTRKLMSIIEDMPIRIKTNELGVFQEIINWIELRDLCYKVFAKLKESFHDVLQEHPEFEKYIDYVEETFSTKKSIEASIINEIHQFYTFHGAKYELGEEYKLVLKTANLTGGEPFDTDVRVWLDEINFEDLDYVIRTVQTVNSEQLTKATFDHLKNSAILMGNSAPDWENFPEVKNETWLSSRIHQSGWVISSLNTKETTSESITNVEERRIELQ